MKVKKPWWLRRFFRYETAMTSHNDYCSGATVDLSGIMEDGIKALGDAPTQDAVNGLFKAQLLDTGHLKPDRFKSMRVGSRTRLLRHYADHSGRHYVGEEPYWTRVFHGAGAIIRTLEERPQLVQGRVVYEMGGGAGAAGIAAKMLGAKHVIISDTQREALAATIHNAAANKVKVDTIIADVTSPIPDDAQVVLAGDVIKYPFLSGAKQDQVRVALNKFRRRGGAVIIADSYLRMSVPYLADAQSDLPAAVRRYYEGRGSPEVDLVVLGPI